MRLSNIQISKAKPQAMPYKLFDGGGLFVLVNPNGSKLWRMKYRFLGKEKAYAIGSYPYVGLAKAREERTQIKTQLAQGVEPIQQRRMAIHKRMEAHENTFEAVARRWLNKKTICENHKFRSLRRLEKHAFPRIGHRSIQEIKTFEIAKCLEQIEDEGINETARRVQQLIQQTFRYAVIRGLIEHNPAGDLRGLIKPPKRKHFACIKPSELPLLLQDIESYRGSFFTLSAIKLLALTFVRTGELVGAQWEEIDWSRQEWRIPAQRMKMRRDHVVPLSRQSLAIFQALKAQTGNREYVFFVPGNKTKHLSNGAVIGALKRMGYKGRMTGHGFRSLASTILNEQQKYRFDVIEAQLAHADRNEIRAVYNNAEYLLPRKAMMQDWADFLERARHGETEIIQLDTRRQSQ